MTAEQDAMIAAAFKTINGEIDMLVAQYDARMLSTAFLIRAARLFNSLRQLEVVTAVQIHNQFAEAVRIVTDDNQPKPKIQQTPTRSVNAKPN